MLRSIRPPSAVSLSVVAGNNPIIAAASVIPIKSISKDPIPARTNSEALIPGVDQPSSRRPVSTPVTSQGGSLLCPPKATSFAAGQRRLIHSGDIKVPDFSAYRRNPDPKKVTPTDEGRGSAYLATATALASGLTLGKWGAHSLVSTWAASKDVLALAKIEVNLNDIPVGKNVVMKWRGKPLFIKHRTSEEIERERAVDVASLRDPEEDSARTKNPEWLVVLGVCTHLGCVPIAGQGDFMGYYCPCHGSHYDASGRIRKGPAPLNLEVPEYEFEGNTLIVG